MAPSRHLVAVPGFVLRYGSAMPHPLPPILIAGPTASGKSALALAIAEAAGGVVINADALQVYRELAILTARPTQEDEARVPHRLYGHVPAAEAYSAGRYATDVAAVLREARAAGLRPIIVGGTGLYIKVLLEGLSPIPAIDAAVREHWRREAQRIKAAGLHAILAERDPVMAARLRPSDPQRLTRALEVLDATGRSLADWQREPGVPVIAEPTVRLVLRPGPIVLRARCEQRFDAMLAAGALDEVRRLSALDLPADVPALGALGVAPLQRHLADAITLAEAVERAKLDTWHFVKRQNTWLKRNMITWNVVHNDEMQRNDRSIIQFIERMPLAG
jgi:tRNA dimethylallyltransferase